MPGPGTWYIISIKDPRWNREGRSPCISGLYGCSELDSALAELKKLYGEPPDDCEIGCMKD